MNISLSHERDEDGQHQTLQEYDQQRFHEFPLFIIKENHYDQRRKTK